MTLPRTLLTCLAAGAAWAAVETAGGLLFLALGVRLWRYELIPLFAAITSPVVWGLAAVLITPVMDGLDRLFRVEALPERRRAAVRLGFLMAAGPLLELALNELVFVGLLGGPLYRYTFLPTVGGSGSLLSPLYYATLYVHVPVAARIRGR